MRRPTPQRGFTTLELLISAVIATIIMAALLSTFVYLGRNLTRLANHQALETQSRRALTYLRRDFALAQSVKTGTIPTASAVTLVLPAGEVTYSYDSSTGRLRRQATFGVNADFYLLKNDFSSCTAFAFDYYTTSEGTPISLTTPGQNVPYSIKQIRVRFTVQTPGVHSPSTQVSYETVSSRYLLRNKPPPTGN